MREIKLKKIKVCLVGPNIAAVVVYRIWITKVVFPDQLVASLLIGTGGSLVLNVAISMIMTKVCNFI